MGAVNQQLQETVQRAKDNLGKVNDKKEVNFNSIVESCLYASNAIKEIKLVEVELLKAQISDPSKYLLVDEQLKHLENEIQEITVSMRRIQCP